MTGAHLTETDSHLLTGSAHPGSGVLGILSNTVWQVTGFVVLWMGIGIATAWVLHKRGHEFGPNAALGAIFGPMFIFLAFDMSRRRESEKPIELTEPGHAPGPPVLVVVVGELDEADIAVEAIAASVGEAGPVTAAVPVEYEVGERVHGMGAKPPVSLELNELAEALAGYSPGLMMLPGRFEKSITRGVQKTGAQWVLLVGSESSSIAPDLEKDLETHVVRVGAVTT